MSPIARTRRPARPPVRSAPRPVRPATPRADGLAAAALGVGGLALVLVAPFATSYRLTVAPGFPGESASTVDADGWGRFSFAGTPQHAPRDGIVLYAVAAVVLVALVLRVIAARPGGAARWAPWATGALLVAAGVVLADFATNQLYLSVVADNAAAVRDSGAQEGGATGFERGPFGWLVAAGGLCLLLAAVLPHVAGSARGGEPTIEGGEADDADEAVT